MLVWLGLTLALAQAPHPPPVELAAGVEDSSYFRFATALAAGVESPRILVQPTHGSAENLRLLRAGRATLAISQGDVAWHAWAGSGRIEADPHLVALGRAFDELVHLVVRDDSDIRAAGDLAGRRVDVGWVGSGSLHNAFDVLHAAGVTRFEPDFSGAYRLERLEAGLVDAVFVTTRAPWDDLVGRAVPLRVVPLDPDTLEVLLEAPYYRQASLPERYGVEGHTAAVETLVVGHRELPDALVIQVLQAMPLTAEGIDIPLHPAAEGIFAGREQPLPEAPKAIFQPPPLPHLPPPVEPTLREAEVPVRYLGPDEVVREAIHRNPGLANAILGQARDELAVRIARSAFQPVLTASVVAGGPGRGLDERVALGLLTPIGTSVAASVATGSSALGREGTWGAGGELVVAQPLLRGAGFDANLAATRLALVDLRSSEAAVQQSGLALVARVQDRYLALEAAYARVGLQRDQLDFARRHVNRVQARQELGQVGELEVQEAAHLQARAEDRLIGELRALRDVEDRLLDELQAHFSYEIVPLGDVETRALARVGTEGTLEDWLARAVAHRPDLRRAALAVERAGVEMAASRIARRPDVTAFGTLATATTGEADTRLGAVGALGAEAQPTWRGGLRLGVPLGPHPDRHRLDRAVLAHQQRQLELDDALEGATREVRAGWRAMDAARQRLELSRLGRELADRKLTLAIEAFQRDEIDSFRVLGHQEEFLDARLRVIAAAADYLRALVELERVSGTGLEPWREVFEARQDAITEHGGARRGR